MADSREQNETVCKHCGNALVFDKDVLYGSQWIHKSGQKFCGFNAHQAEADEAAVPTVVPLEPREWLEGQTDQRSGFMIHAVAMWMAKYSSHVNAAMIAKLATQRKRITELEMLEKAVNGTLLGDSAKSLVTDFQKASGEVNYALVSPEMIAERLRAADWVKVEERLPEDGWPKLVRTVYEDGNNWPRIEMGHFVERWYVTDGREVTHWMPLPDSPINGGE